MCRQNTSTIKEDILLAVERVLVNQDEIRRLLNVAKTISYNPVERSIQFNFFDRATARNFGTVTIPFRSVVYRVNNVHLPATDPFGPGRLTELALRQPGSMLWSSIMSPG